MSAFVLTLVSGPAPAGDRDVSEVRYSVQVQAVPLAEAEDGLATYRGLRDKGYLSYAYRVEINGAPWLRVAVGAFASRGAAAEFGRVFMAVEGGEPFVTRAPIRVFAGADDHDFVITPSALWLRGGDGPREVFAFEATAPNAGRLIHDLNPAPSPSGDALAFIYETRVYVASLDDPGVRPLTEPGAPYVTAEADYPWRIGWSPSGRHVAFLDQALWEHPIGLWVARADGGALVCVACNRDGQSAVRWFVWHPEEDRVLFVEGFSGGTVAVGGGLFSAEVDGTVSPVAAATRGEREEIAGPLGIEDGHLSFRRVQHDSEYMDKTMTDDRLPVGAL